MSQNEDIRKNASWISRLFSRAHYSQSGILHHIDKLYKNAHETSPSDIVDYNLEKLIEKAQKQNTKHQKSHFRLFKAKSHINVKPYEQTRAHIKNEKPTPVEVKTEDVKSKANPLSPLAAEKENPWWNDAEMDELVIQDCFNYYFELKVREPLDLLKLINPSLHITPSDKSKHVLLEAMLKTLGLETVKDFKDRGIFGPLSFQDYLSDPDNKCSGKLIASRLAH